MSGMDYFDDDHVMYEVRRLAINHPGHELRINFSTDTLEPDDVPCGEWLRKSIIHYMQHLPKHLSSHNVEPGCLGDVVLQHTATNRDNRTYMYAVDDRGGNYVVFVNQA